MVVLRGKLKLFVFVFTSFLLAVQSVLSGIILVLSARRTWSHSQCSWFNCYIALESSFAMGGMKGKVGVELTNGQIGNREAVIDVLPPSPVKHKPSWLSLVFFIFLAGGQLNPGAGGVGTTHVRPQKVGTPC